MKIAIFGGTFDPIHNAHLAIAEAARKKFEIDKVLVIPAANPPHKAGANASFEHRYRMIELACEGVQGLEPSRLDDGEERSYSIRTIEKLRAAGAQAPRYSFSSALMPSRKSLPGTAGAKWCDKWDSLL